MLISPSGLASISKEYPVFLIPVRHKAHPGVKLGVYQRSAEMTILNYDSLLVKVFDLPAARPAVGIVIVPVERFFFLCLRRAPLPL